MRGLLGMSSLWLWACFGMSSWAPVNMILPLNFAEDISMGHCSLHRSCRTSADSVLVAPLTLFHSIDSMEQTTVSYALPWFPWAGFAVLLATPSWLPFLVSYTMGASSGLLWEDYSFNSHHHCHGIRRWEF